MKLLGITLIVFFSQVAPANETYPLNQYIDFIVEWSSYKYSGEPLPQVKVTKHGLVQIFAYGEYTVAQSEYKNETLPTVNAVYDVERKTIFISDKVSALDPLLQAALVHELVHYLQDINGYTASLNGHIECTESEAYDIQMLWQIENKVNLSDIKYIQERSLLSAMRCMGDMSKAFKSRYIKN